MASSSPPILAVFIIVFILLMNLGCIDGFNSGLLLNRSRRARPGSSRSRSRLRWDNVTLSVSQFGARGDGCTDDTQAFVEAWKLACSLRAIAVIEIPAGNEYLFRPVELGRPCKCKLMLLVSGRIITPSDPDLWEGLDPHNWLYFHGVKDLVVTGGGAIDGMGQEWWARSCKRNATNPCRHAPMVVTFSQNQAPHNL